MMRTIKQLLVALMLSFLLMNDVVANDDVIVDLSVLDNLNNNAAITFSAPQKPLFPIVKKRPPIKKKTTKKQTAIQKTASKPKPTTKNSVTAKTKEQPQPIPFVESNEDIIVVDVEPTPKQAEMQVQTNQENVTNSVAKPLIEQQPSSDKTSDTTEYVTPKGNEAQTPALLLDENSNATVKTSSLLLRFASGVDELNDEQQKLIDEAISKFDNPLQNKIAIYAYNIDDGIDAFKRKRISLNRAVAVRSYLLPKGYKNFSIKVINVDKTSDKADMVALEELKN